MVAGSLLLFSSLLLLAPLPAVSGAWPKHAGRVMFPKTFETPTDGKGSK